jgi:hypothetical protein
MNKLLTFLLVSLGVLTFAGAGIVSAHGGGFGGWGFSSDWIPEDIASRFESMFEQKAEFLGISVDDFKSKWAEGKNFMQIAEEAGVTQEQLQERVQQARQEQLRAQLNALVGQGIISQEQADQRFNALQEQFANQEGQMWGRGMRGGPCMHDLEE